jgi:rfaE bifunctional protein kinase chain/domain
MLTDTCLEQILARIPVLTIGVLGDLFLDRYLDIDDALTEPSLETGLDAYQVVRVRSFPGAAGTVINNLVALGVRRVYPMAVIGDDGEGYELRQALAAQTVVAGEGIFAWADRRTPTYTKPMVHRRGQAPRELNRLDIKNRVPLAAPAEDRVLRLLGDIWPELDALIVLDQVSEPDCGVVTARVRQRLRELGETHPDRLILADSRERLGLFRSVWLKPNRTECLAACGHKLEASAKDPSLALQACVIELARKVGRPVFCTQGEQGIRLVDPRRTPLLDVQAPAFPVTGPIDVVGAGDSTSAAITCAIAAGASLAEAAALGNLVASITIQQLGTTGTATPDQIRRRWQEVRLA